jgi:hypothetical protein
LSENNGKRKGYIVKSKKSYSRLLMTTQTFIEKAKKIHGKKYDYSKTIYIKTGKKLEIVCCRCNQSFFQIANDHLTGHGCSKCNRIDGQSKKKLTTEIFIERAKKIHGNNYDYSKVKYNGCQKNVIIICIQCKSEFTQCPLHHMHGSECPICNKIKRISKLEKEFLNYIDIPSDLKNRQVVLNGYIVDGFRDNIIFEFLGDYWHGNPNKYDFNKINICNGKTFKQLYDETVIRFNHLKNYGYTINYIWETDWVNYVKKKISDLKIHTFNGINI